MLYSCPHCSRVYTVGSKGIFDELFVPEEKREYSIVLSVLRDDLMEVPCKMCIDAGYAGDGVILKADKLQEI